MEFVPSHVPSRLRAGVWLNCRSPEFASETRTHGSGWFQACGLTSFASNVGAVCSAVTVVVGFTVIDDELEADAAATIIVAFRDGCEHVAEWIFGVYGSPAGASTQ